MNIQHTILQFTSATGSIVVKYFCNELPDGLVYNIDLPITDGQYPTEAEMLALIEAYKPTGQIKRITDVAAATPPQYLLDIQPVTQSPLTDTVGTQDQIHEAAKALVLEVLHEQGVLQ